MIDWSTHEGWHPGESPEFLEAAITRAQEKSGMTNETPPQRGLTRRDTKLPHPQFAGWYIEPEEEREIQRRADRRATDNGSIPDEVIRRAPMRAVSRDVVPNKRKGKSA